MADTHWLENVASALLTGGAAALTTVLGSFKDLKDRLSKLETWQKKITDTLGNNEEPKTGLYAELQTLTTAYQSVQRSVKAVQGWEHEPPDWLRRVGVRPKMESLPDLSEIRDQIDSLDRKLRQLTTRITDLEETHQRPSITGTMVTKEQYDLDNEQRARDLAAIRGEVSAANGMLRGLVSLLTPTTRS